MDQIRSCLDASLLRPGWEPCWKAAAAVGAVAGGATGLFTGLTVKKIGGLTLEQTVGCSAGVGAAGGALATIAASALCLACCCDGEDDDDTQSQQGPSVASRTVTNQPRPGGYLIKPNYSSRACSGSFRIPMGYFTGSHYGYYDGGHGGCHDGGHSGGHGGCGGGGGE
ncbi:hypothetical protein [Endozoicomonas sp. SESOKO1]|uniref:hypothetical protein n=1 Tax=Endozoicomonas sp. SESOKO1 TaxID=2828742 RepID=UPI0021481A8A|nr:hypothetical protein [Endozoicomonas sp. SESOKO1]